jgi:hypothetical protein
LPSRRNDLAALEVYALSAAGLAPIPAIEDVFRFSPLEIDRKWIRSLAPSAADQMQIEKWKLQFELDQFFRLDPIQERERIKRKRDLFQTRRIGPGN